MKLKNKTIIVTGASRGLGAAMAEECAREGAQLVITAPSLAELDAVTGQVRAAGWRVEPVQAEVALAPPGAFYLVLTHSHDLDLAIAQAILARGDFGYFGLIGSQTKRARFEHRLASRGVAPALLQRMVCPIGVPGIAGKEPEVIAVAVVAQLLQVQAVVSGSRTAAAAA
jgi:xanthine/CO dehydrogenase XdhC/CoxF family maturation factor